ncbi:MAG: threonine synthase [Elusimicrobia bacterium]|nr:threonine synthase [Elusimicrobiota bacterium]
MTKRRDLPLTALGFRCFRCGRETASAEYVCPSCSGNLEVVYDLQTLKRRLTRSSLAKDPDASVWRWKELLPIARFRGVPLARVGGTPLYRAERLGRDLGLKEVWLKDDGRNPSASFKDRAGAVAVAKALELGERVVTGASTGNAASSMACLAAGLGLKTIIFVPQKAPAAKIAQLLVFGATVIAVKGTYDQAFDLCLKATEEFGWYNRNTGHNPFTREGKKTASFEIAEQLGWTVPDAVFVSVGDGNIISGVWKGFKELRGLGLIDRLPRMVAVQAEGSAAVKKAFESDGVIRPVSGETLADSISVSLPRDGEAAVRALVESGGSAVSVTDAEILDAMKVTARREGVFAEPAGAASVAGLRKAASLGLVRPGEKVLALITGNGLKDVASALKAAGKPFLIEPEAGELRKLVRKESLGGRATCSD